MTSKIKKIKMKKKENILKKTTKHTKLLHRKKKLLKNIEKSNKLPKKHVSQMKKQPSLPQVEKNPQRKHKGLVNKAKNRGNYNDTERCHIENVLNQYNLRCEVEFKRRKLITNDLQNQILKMEILSKNDKFNQYYCIICYSLFIPIFRSSHVCVMCKNKICNKCSVLDSFGYRYVKMFTENFNLNTVCVSKTKLFQKYNYNSKAEVKIDSKKCRFCSVCDNSRKNYLKFNDWFNELQKIKYGRDSSIVSHILCGLNKANNFSKCDDNVIKKIHSIALKNNFKMTVLENNEKALTQGVDIKLSEMVERNLISSQKLIYTLNDIVIYNSKIMESFPLTNGQSFRLKLKNKVKRLIIKAKEKLKNKETNNNIKQKVKIHENIIKNANMPNQCKSLLNLDINPSKPSLCHNCTLSIENGNKKQIKLKKNGLIYDGPIENVHMKENVIKTFKMPQCHVGINTMFIDEKSEPSKNKSQLNYLNMKPKKNLKNNIYDSEIQNLIKEKSNSCTDLSCWGEGDILSCFDFNEAEFVDLIQTDFNMNFSNSTTKILPRNSDVSYEINPTGNEQILILFNYFGSIDMNSSFNSSCKSFNVPTISIPKENHYQNLNVDTFEDDLVFDNEIFLSTSDRILQLDERKNNFENLKIVNAVNNPEFVLYPTSINIYRGENANFRCVLRGSLPFNIYWYCESSSQGVVELKDTSRILIETEDYCSSFSLFHCDYADSGHYYIVVINDVSQSSHHFTLTVLAKKELYKFLRLLSINNEINCTDIKRFVDHINNLKKDIESRFIDILDLKINDSMTDSFSTDIRDADIPCQKELLEIQHDEK
ncbi:hypothetical protein A3Q56_02539 [Intoshia linei]|uniref:Ig-like domain-containing protein n=1 Tax=Intoshia linei TaxID=1819745 RepID=A0A177B637_9BILA|nr:hypothetical protein A3Q56_02539 [Intoshia linei]